MMRQTQWELFEQELRKVDVVALKQYLTENGWRQVEYKGGKLEVWANEEQDLLAFAASTRFSDYYSRLADVFGRLEEIEHVWMPKLVMKFQMRGEDGR